MSLEGNFKTWLMQEQVFKFSYSKRMHSSQNERSMNKSKDICVEVYRAQKIIPCGILIFL